MTSDANARRELAELLCERSVQSGDFELASGKSASVYVDVKKTALSGKGATLIGAHLWSVVGEHAPEAKGVGGLTLGADPLVSAISMAAWLDGRDLPAIIVRKEAKGHGTQRFLEHPDTLDEGDEIVAVDDVITTGGSTLDAIDKMRQAGFEVRHAICVVDREDVGAQRLADAGVALHPLFTLSELLEICGPQ
jgi:orotate phosphoribosyltransferase